MATKGFLLLGQIIIYILHQYNDVNALIGANIRQAKENEFPYLVSIQRLEFNDDRPVTVTVCGGTLITSRDVLTAAHCLTFVKKQPMEILVGSIVLAECKRYASFWWITYDEWMLHNFKDPGIKEHDIAIIKLVHNVSEEIVPATISMNSYFNENNIILTVPGWGVNDENIQPKILQAVDLKIISKEECKRRFKDIYKLPPPADERYLCSSRDPYALISLGDSGGPILYEGKVIGINSGVCPGTGPMSEKINIHFAIYLYMDFIRDIVVNFN